MTQPIEVAILGAGPNGLSLAAHLAALSIPCRIFGIPMESWRMHMPPGMHLKSDGSSSDIADPEEALTLEAFCTERGYKHHSTKVPVSLEHFVEYGLAFQRRLVPQLEPKIALSLEKLPEAFRLRFADGDSVLARRVVVAVGVMAFKRMPGCLSDLPSELVSHSSQYGAISHLTGRRVAIVGAGSSAMDLAALLHEARAEVCVISRREDVDFHGAPTDRALWRRMARPTSHIGNGWRLLTFASLPRLFYHLPERVRHHQVGTLLGPAAGWFVKDRVLNTIPIMAGLVPVSAAVNGDRVALDVMSAGGTRRVLIFDHVIAATGYKVDVERLSFLDSDLRSKIRRDTGGLAPRLSINFESSVDGLFFVGPVAMNSFGPVVRFVYGARYTARRLSSYIAGLQAPVGKAKRPQRSHAPIAEDPSEPLAHR